MRAPWAIENGHSELPHFFGVGREDSEWGQRHITGGRRSLGISAANVPLFAAQWAHRLAGRSNKWASFLSSGVCHGRKGVRLMAYA